MIAQTLVPADEAAALRLFKVTGPNGEPLHGGSGRWSLPSADSPGEWWDVDTVEACHSGLHLTDEAHLSTWLPSYGDPIVWRAETRGPVYRVHEDKYVTGSARLLPRGTRKGPSIETLRARRDTALRRAERRETRATDALGRAVGPGWAAYARAAGDSARVVAALPDYVRAALTTWRAELSAARQLGRAAEDKYRTAAALAIMPEETR